MPQLASTAPRHRAFPPEYGAFRGSGSVPRIGGEEGEGDRPGGGGMGTDGFDLPPHGSDRYAVICRRHVSEEKVLHPQYLKPGSI